MKKIPYLEREIVIDSMYIKDYSSIIENAFITLEKEVRKRIDCKNNVIYAGRDQTRWENDQNSTLQRKTIRLYYSACSYIFLSSNFNCEFYHL